MTVNIEALINKLGKSYDEIFADGLIPYKSKPTGYPGDPELSIEMAKEGIHLAFKRDGKRLFAIGLILLNEKKPKYRFPGDLPSPLVPEMSRQWVHEQFGEPDKFLPPRKRLRKDIGYTDLFTVTDFQTPTSMQISYDLHEHVRLVTFISTAELRW